jgi:hypothetical protein
MQGAATQMAGESVNRKWGTLDFSLFLGRAECALFIADAMNVCLILLCPTLREGFAIQLESRATALRPFV